MICFSLSTEHGPAITMTSSPSPIPSRATTTSSPTSLPFSAIVHGALVALRLNGARNINCVDGLKRLLGWQLDAAHCVPAGCV